MTECFFKMSFKGNIQNVFSSQVVRYQMQLRHTAHARKSLTSVCDVQNFKDATIN